MDQDDVAQQIVDCGPDVVSTRIHKVLCLCGFAAQHQEWHIIPNDDKEENTTSVTSVNDEVGEEEATILDDLPTMTSPTRERRSVLFEFDEKVKAEPIKEGDTTAKQAALRKCHERLNHMLFARSQSMAKKGLLPRYFVDIEAPFCTSCAMGKQRRGLGESKDNNGKQQS